MPCGPPVNWEKKKNRKKIPSKDGIIWFPMEVSLSLVGFLALLIFLQFLKIQSSVLRLGYFFHSLSILCPQVNTTFQQFFFWLPQPNQTPVIFTLPKESASTPQLFAAVTTTQHGSQQLLLKSMYKMYLESTWERYLVCKILSCVKWGR